jgi:Bacterial PH domain
MTAPVQSFRLAPMSPLILVLTLVLLALPLVFLANAAVGGRVLLVPGLLLIVIYAWIWFWFRPILFLVRPGALEVVWPLRRRELRREEISDVRLIDKDELRRKTGWAMRVGAGGLWGGFGWLWTERRGIVQMYVSRTDGLVWIERGDERPWLITPEHPTAFVRILSGR